MSGRLSGPLVVIAIPILIATLAACSSTAAPASLSAASPESTVAPPAAESSRSVDPLTAALVGTYDITYTLSETDYPKFYLNVGDSESRVYAIEQTCSAPCQVTVVSTNPATGKSGTFTFDFKDGAYTNVTSGLTSECLVGGKETAKGYDVSGTTTWVPSVAVLQGGKPVVTELIGHRVQTGALTKAGKKAGCKAYSATFDSTAERRP
jgi:hypothetical protein